MRPVTRLVPALLAATLASAGRSHAAAPDDLPSAWRTMTIGVLPTRTVGSDVFGEGQIATVVKEDAERWTAALTALVERDQMEMLAPEVLRYRLRGAPDIKRTLELAAERYDLGLERWRALNPKDALGHLDRALALASEALAAIADPKLLADVQFQRGLVLRELGDVLAARDAFVAALELDPARRVKRGYYDADTEKALETAARDLADRPNGMQALWPDDLLGALARRLGLDIVVVSALEPGGALRVVLWDAKTRAPARSEVVATADAANTRRLLDRAIAAWHTCALEAEQGLARQPPRRTWHVDVGYAHSVWLTHRRTREFLHGPGAAIAIKWEPSSGLEAFFRMGQQATLSDANGDLLDVFTTTRFTLGAALAVGPRHLRFAVRAGIDVQIAVADIATTQDVDCKWFGDDSDRCGSIFIAESPAIWLGIDFGINLRWFPVREFYFNLDIGNASYLLSPSAAAELNFPLYGSVGFGLPL